MNKSQEITLLSLFIDSLPADSYLRHWMDSVFEEIRTDITNDFFPTSTPADSRRLAAEIEARAKQTAADTIALAKSEAAQLIQEAQKSADLITARMQREQYKLRRAWQDLEAVF